MGKIEDKKEILELVRKYIANYHREVPYHKGDKILYASRVYDENEVVNLVDASLDFWLTNGQYTFEFEHKLAEFLKLKYVSFVNSGSSANLLAISALTSPLLKERQLKKGDEVITVACGFPTTINPIIQNGLVPVFVDVTIPGYNIDVSKLEQAYSPKTKAIILAHTLGNPFDINKVKAFCKQHNLWLIEDNCDALGSKYQNQYTGTFGDIGTSSFFPAHHITTGEGGAIYTNNPLLHQIIRSLRDWGRDCICPSGQDNTCNQRFNGTYGLLPSGYDHKYVYSHFGYNLKATDLQAAIGLAQLDKLDDFTNKRITNFNYLNKCMLDNKLDKYFILPTKTKESEPSWFGYLLTCKDMINRNDLVNYLEKHNIQTRMLFGGNIIKQPLFNELKLDQDYRIIDTLENTDKIMNNSFWLGVYPLMNKDKMDYMIEIIREYINK